MIHIVLDAMGGDFAPEVNLDGALLATQSLAVKITLVGPQVLLEEKIKAYPQWPSEKIVIVDAPEVVGMSESPSLSFRKKKNSSIQIGLNLVKEGKADAFVSAGNTGAVMTASSFILGRLPEVDRPVLAGILPSEKRPYVMLDMGSNVDCKPQHLVQFAVMGNFFAKNILDIHKPTVALLNIGEEKDKGNTLTLTTYKLLENMDLNFVGNIEGKELTKGKVDVVVCDGFVGNSMLKFGEGIIKLVMDFFKKEAKTSLVSLVGLFFLRPALKRFQKQFDYEEYGGAHLLGVNGISIIAHGSAGKIAIKNAIKTAMVGVENNVVEKIKSAIIERASIAALTEEVSKAELPNA